jgi:anti-sigma-K factor RskA
MEPLAHDDLREQAAAYALGALTAEERLAYEAHLATCAECQAEVRSLGDVTVALAQTVPQVEPSASLRARILAYPSKSGASQPPSGEASGRAPSALPSWLALAASLALAAALGLYALQLRGRVETLEARLQDALARAQASESQTAEVRRVSNEMQSQIAVLTAPDVTRVDLAGLAVAPSASARAFLSQSRGLVLSASNLPPLPAGRTYQLWFITGQTPRGAGTFQPDAAGSSSVLLPVDPGTPRPQVLAVTNEPAGGSLAPTAPLYLQGSVPAAF